MASARVAYSARTGATPEAELNAIASVYRFIIESHAKKKATRPSGPDDAKEIKNGCADTDKYT